MVWNLARLLVAEMMVQDRLVVLGLMLPSFLLPQVFCFASGYFEFHQT